MNKKPTVLMILDGFGLNQRIEANAAKLSASPNIDRILNHYPFVQGHASGMAVGLPEGQMGNSEVGHLNIGAGRIVYQELTKITKSILDGDFFDNKALAGAVDHCLEKGTALHLYGLLSDGGVHSHNTHLYALLELAKKKGLEKVYVHCFLDGRDTPPASGKSFVEELEAKIQEIGVGRIATVMGRYYAMDRDNRWDRVKLAYEAMVLGQGVQADDAVAGVQASYDAGSNDEFVKPLVVQENGAPVARIAEGDAIIFYNFRPDRAREITRVFLDQEFKGFERAKGYFPVHYVGFTNYDITIQNLGVAFEKDSLEKTLGEYLSEQGMTQLRLAETEKYAHVTFFFNGGVEEPYKGEDRILIASPMVATYDLQPEMSAFGVLEALVKAIREKKHDLIVVNFANPDMVGHTGVETAAIQAVQAVDECVGEALEALVEAGGQMFVCADHGNIEQLLDYETRQPFTAHTTNPVPFVLVNAEQSLTLRENGVLADIAPTLLDMMGVEIPRQMTGKSLLVR
ncbi:2,3-bisphosphoglycerate-independent phosphoglycerate mutase [Anaerotalea alkaliphila]|uniref:2,3-bisphosphoglycerate-independent phosphoglycerate mutase n=1 Tax=Anaerotalea alkaliphila TaxID=2662126 RepID=A0A7X5KMW9_9FIRM|nr:2,3-bisphosphoglycerate-independent phosphoglycerate mutase [Anaerotalea alkaliphila]NDL66197.1 2,3-bisphosphoglycerate-independent phosphoglycerate mutase [Anaerotalea alkaliphila]